MSEKIKVTFVVDVDDACEKWSDADAEVFEDSLRESLDVWGDIRDVSIEVQQ